MKIFQLLNDIIIEDQILGWPDQTTWLNDAQVLLCIYVCPALNELILSIDETSLIQQ